MLSIFFMSLILLIFGLWFYLEYHIAAGAQPKDHDYSPNFHNGRFVNAEPTKVDDSFRAVIRLLREYYYASHLCPDRPLPVSTPSPAAAEAEEPHLTWFGHSTVMLETDGTTILIDPMLSAWIAPLPFLGHRFHYSDAFDLSALGEIDLMLITHDHFDHLDYPTLKALQGRTRLFVVPLGVGDHLRRWGIEAERIEELDWWQDCEVIEGLRITATPARHFSGRSFGRRRSTLWAGYVIETPSRRYFCGGDSGYGTHFKEIGLRFGPFDLTMLDCAQYHPDWSHLHMSPEEAWQVHQELAGKYMLPIHWGAFSLSTHPWYEPIERLLEVSDQPDHILLPAIGQRLSLTNIHSCNLDCWWRSCLPADQIGSLVQNL